MRGVGYACVNPQNGLLGPETERLVSKKVAILSGQAAGFWREGGGACRRHRAMSDQSRGPGWWLASDGKWYPPDRHVNYRPPSPPEPPGSEPLPSERVVATAAARSRRWLLAIPIGVLALIVAGLAGAAISDGDEEAQSTTTVMSSASSTTSTLELSELDDEALADAWQDVLDDLTGELRANGYPNPRSQPYAPTGTPDSAAAVMNAYFERDGYRAALLDLWDVTEGHVPYVDRDLRGRLQAPADTDDLWRIVADLTGNVVGPLQDGTNTTVSS